MMDTKPLVSILMPAFNAAPYISESIQSILDQSYANWELIIVDDGSKDETFSIAKSYAQKDPRMLAIQQPNVGASAARNRAFALSKGDYVKYFDADDLLNPEAIEAQVNLALKNPGYIISGKWGRFYNNDLFTFKLSPEGVWRDMNGVDWIIESWSKGPNMTQPGIFLLPRRLVEDHGGWDESLNLMDDMEMFTRLILEATSIIFCEDATLYYRSGIPGRLSASKSREAFESAFKSVRLSASYLLEKSKAAEARTAAANQYQVLAYSCYPNFPGITEWLENQISLLGGSTVPFPGGRPRKLLAKALGWKKAAKLHRFYEKVRYSE